MAVPQIPRARALDIARAVRVPLVLDIVVGLLIALVVPLAIVTIPNTISVVADLLPAGVSRIAMTRAHGMSLPAMLLTVPLALVAARRFRAAPLLVIGLALLAVTDAAGGFAASPLVVGVLRGLHGVGAGLLVPATLLAAWERPSAARRVLVSLWAGSLAASLLTAQALALWPLDEATSWRVTLQPYPLVTGVALAVGAVYLVLWLVAGGSRVAATPAVVEGGRLLPAVAPTAGIAALALGTTFDWPPMLTLVAAGVSVVVLFTLGLAGAPGGSSGRVLAITMTVVGLVALPTAAQTTYVELGGVGGPGLIGLWLPFTIGSVAALAAAVLAGRLTDSASANLVRGGLAAVVVGLSAIRLLVPTPNGMILTVPFALIAAGAAVAMAAAMWTTSVGAALFALTLCFPAVLAGFLLGTGMQIARVRAVERSANPSAQALVDGFVATLHTWALVGGFTVVAGLVLTAFLFRRKAADDAAHPDPDRAVPDHAKTGWAEPEIAPASSPDRRVYPTAATDVLVARGEPAHGPRPVIPAPSPSPEASANAPDRTGRDGAGSEDLGIGDERRGGARGDGRDGEPS